MTPEIHIAEVRSATTSADCSLSYLDHCQAAAIKSVWYVTMAFPVPSEAFASVEVNELQRRKVDVSVKTIRSLRSDNALVTAQQQVSQVPVGHADWRSPLRGLCMAAVQPHLSIRLWWKLCTTLAHRPVVLLACLFWSLRCFELLAAIKREKPDVVHLYWGHVPSMLGWMVLESLPKQILTIGLSAYDLQMAIPLSYEVAGKCAGVRSWAMANVDVIQSCGISSEQIQVVHQGVSIQQFTREGSPHKTETLRRLIFAGRLIPKKGVELVIELTHRVLEVFPDVELVIIGTGPLYGELSQQVERLGVQHCVHLRGHLAHSELGAELRCGRLFLLPSSHPAERLPNVIKEAAAAGCCCLTTATPGIETLIRDGESGRILPADDLDAWVTAVTELLSHPERAQKMADAANRRVHEHFDIERTTDQLIAWWDSLLAKSANASRGSL